MITEYLLFNIVVLSGPLLFGSMKQFYFLDKTKKAVFAIVLSSIPFILWDVSVTNRHWFFSDSYTLGIQILNLPFEEILFFITVPYACLFTWQMLKKTSFHLFTFSFSSNVIGILFLIGGITISFTMFALGKEYTSLALLFFIASLLFDLLYGAKICNNNIFVAYMSLVTIFTLIFNGYLTWRPIVTYNSIYQLDYRILTIPIEDFFFGYALIILCTSIFEKSIQKGNK